MVDHMGTGCPTVGSCLVLPGISWSWSFSHHNGTACHIIILTIIDYHFTNFSLKEVSTDKSIPCQMNGVIKFFKVHKAKTTFLSFFKIFGLFKSNIFRT